MSPTGPLEIRDMGKPVISDPIRKILHYYRNPECPSPPLCPSLGILQFLLVIRSNKIINHISGYILLKAYKMLSPVLQVNYLIESS